MSTLSQFFGGGGGVLSIPVEVFILGGGGGGGGGGGDGKPAPAWYQTPEGMVGILLAAVVGYKFLLAPKA